MMEIKMEVTARNKGAYRTVFKVLQKWMTKNPITEDDADLYLWITEIPESVPHLLVPGEIVILMDHNAKRRELKEKGVLAAKDGTKDLQKTLEKALDGWLETHK